MCSRHEGRRPLGSYDPGSLAVEALKGVQLCSRAQKTPLVIVDRTHVKTRQTGLQPCAYSRQDSVSAAGPSPTGIVRKMPRSIVNNAAWGIGSKAAGRKVAFDRSLTVGRKEG